MKPVPKLMPSPARGRWTAFAVLALALAATAFAAWREHMVARQAQIIRWQDSFAQLRSTLGPALMRPFENLHDQANITLRRDHFTEAAWQEFLITSEWHQRFPGVVELGYAAWDGRQSTVQFVSARQGPPAHPTGTVLDRNPALGEALQKSADLGYGVPSGTVSIQIGSNQVPVVMGFVPVKLQDLRPGPPEQNRTNLYGFIFFALNQQEYFRSLEAQLQEFPVELQLLGPEEPPPPRTLSQRYFTMGGLSGDWRLVARMKAPSARAELPQYIVLACGTALSWLLFWLFSTQARLRAESELAQEQILQRDAAITTLNRDLEQKIAQRTAELRDALQEEKELNRLKGNFISMVTHEIRTPLALILGSSEILSRYLERLSPAKRAEHLHTIDAAVQRMSGLLEDVLLFSKAEAGRMEFHPEPIDLPKFCAQLVDELASATGRRCPVELSVESSEAARADEGLLRHIFSNLLGNAVKYSPAGATVQFSVTRAEGDAVFVVKDRGMGVPEEDRKRLFTPFYRGRNAAPLPGTGLGLVIVKHCVERHGGQITLESAPNAGTTVTVRLPLFSPAHTDFVRRLTATATA